MKRKSVQQRRGFSLAEILVSVAIVSVLATLSVAGYSIVLENARRTAEMTAGRNLITAYLQYPVENNGRLLPGIQRDHPDEKPVYHERGFPMPHYLSKRWPYRLAPYFNYNYADVAVINEAKESYESGGDYIASVYPSFGLNTTFVGGNWAPHHTEPVIGPEGNAEFNLAVTRMSQAVAPTKLIVFVSSTQDSFSGDDGKTYGSFYVLSPSLAAPRWAETYRESLKASQTGYVHPRWDGQAVALHLDGSMAVLDYNELKDMTRWSNQAAQANDPDWYVGKY